MPDQSDALQAARASLGLTSTSRVLWLLAFARRDVSQLTEQDLLFLQQQLLVFLGHEEDARRNRFPHRDTILAWQGQMRRGLLNLSQARSWEIDAVGRFIAERQGFKIADRSTHDAASSDHWPFTFHAIATILRAGNALQFCANSRCSQLHVRNHRQGYCSIRCRNAANKRLYRQRSRQSENSTTEDLPPSDP